MKKFLLMFVAFTVLASSCADYEGEFNDFEDTEDQWDGGDNDTDDDTFDGGEGGNSGGNSDAEAGGEGSLTLYSVHGDEINKMKDFDVKNKYKSFQQDYAKHLAMWEFTVRLIPIEYRDKIVEFEVFHGEDQLLGYVFPINNGDLSKWRFALAIDSAEELENINFQDMFTYTTLHEYGHVLTLSDEQLDVNANTCSTYNPGEGCAQQNAYINKLYELGWADIANEAPEQGDDTFEFYQKYSDRFVTDYAATNPAEDIAEVFSFFITKADKPSGNSIAEQKIKLLYDYPELVEMRDKIRQSETVQALRAGSWRTNPLSERFQIRCKRKCGHQHAQHADK